MNIPLNSTSASPTIKKYYTLFTLLLVASCLSAADSNSSDKVDRFISTQDLTWTSLGKDENDSMPIGNGDLAANVWTEQSGDLVALVAKSDAWTEMGKLVKLGRIRVKLTPNPFIGGADITQVLKLETGEIYVKSGTNLIRIWVDANHPVMHIEVHLDQPATLQAAFELWRTKSVPYGKPSPEMGGLFELGGHPLPVNFEPDTILPAQSDRVTWCHFNSSSIYPIVLKEEHLDSLRDKYPDPFMHRCFGATMAGPGLVSRDDHTLKSCSPSQDLRLDLYVLTREQAKSPEAWQTNLQAMVKDVNTVNVAEARQAHGQWWSDFWARSWINLTGTPDARKISQGYAMQRWMMACSSRGAQPTKFNGGLFTVGHDMPEGKESGEADHNPDYRKWGSCFWNQNNRLLYWPLIATGDEDLLKPWFDMYLKALPLAKDRTQLYFHHEGAAFIETLYFFGLPNINDFGWDNPSNELSSSWVRYHIQGALEIIGQMLDSYDATEDSNFARSSLVPFAEAITTYYDQHWPRGADGKIHMTPVQSLEIYQGNATNPTPDIAGLHAIMPRLQALPHDLTSQSQRDLWSKMVHDLPGIPMGHTAHGKLPPLGQGDPDGIPTILPAEKYGQPCNVENPELYVTFPYRLYGVGKPDLDLARNTYAARRSPQDTCWGQDGTQAAILGLTDEAKKAVIAEFTEYGNQRYKWFWTSRNDWIPDLDNGGAGMITLQLMLMQCDGKRIRLLPAWPTEWMADFKLHAPFQTTVEGHVENGKITNLKVIPKSRAQDVEMGP